MTIYRQAIFGKLDISLFKNIERATAYCKLRSNPYVEIVHWLYQIFLDADSDFKRCIQHFKIDTEALNIGFEKTLNCLPSGANAISDFSSHIETAIERAWIHASLEFGDSRIRSGHLLLALLSTPELRMVLLNIFSDFQKISIDQLASILPVIAEGSTESQEVDVYRSTLPGVIPGESSGAIMDSDSGKSCLTRYCSDLTSLAREGKIDPVIGRDCEIRTIVDILLRRRQNNPLLTGEAGVGKTAVVEGLALAIVNGEVPPVLTNARLLSLDVGALLAGASLKGEFELRLKGVLEEASTSSEQVILFVDEVHTLIGAGGAVGTGDAANLLKPVLARGLLRTIGATTWGEYKRYIEKDSALTRRFQVLQVQEPEVASAITMVRGLVKTLEKHHGVLILDDAISAAVKFSHRYIPARQLPDKAISLLDTACARVAVGLHAPPALIQTLRLQLSASQVELDMLEKEHRLGKITEEKTDALRVNITGFEQKIHDYEKHWNAEKFLVSRVLKMREIITEMNSNNQNSNSSIVIDTTVDIKKITQDPILSTTEDGIADEVIQAKETINKKTLIQLENELAELQQDTPLVQAEVSESVIAAIVAEWTGIPAGRMLKHEIDAVLDLPSQLAQRVIGQSSAIALVSEQIQIARANLRDPGKPIGVFMLIGPSGVGKTETALAIAEILYGGEQNLITINMSEYQEAHTVSSLKGAPPGYVGYGEGGILTEAVRRRPYSVILLDEVEKAHSDVHQMFYQVFDKGSMEDGEGRHIDFKNTVLILTSNVGDDVLVNLCKDPERATHIEVLRDAVQPELLKVFPIAFVGRVCVVPYLPLVQETLIHIVRLHLDHICERMLDNHQIRLEYSPEVIAKIISHCSNAETGARMSISFIEQRILPGISRCWLSSQGGAKSVKRIRIEVKGDIFLYDQEFE